MEKWRGKIAVVTGGSSGIGLGIVKMLLGNKITTINLDISEPTEEFNENFHFKKCDVSSLESIQEAFKWVEEKFETVHILVNNAGIGNFFQILEMSEENTEKISKTINVNFLGLVHCAREALRMMQKSNDYSMIINTSSVAGMCNPYPVSLNVYGPTKHAIRSFSEVLRQELAIVDNIKIRVTNLCPGVVMTKLYESTKVDFKKLQEIIPNALKPKDIADGVEYVLSTPYTVNVSEITIRSIPEKF